MKRIKKFQEKKFRKQFFDRLGIRLGYKCMDDWYNVAKKDVYGKYGREILNYYDNSYIDALLDVYSEHNWEVFRFKNKPFGFWKKNENGKKFFDWLKNRLGYKCMDDWYYLKMEDIYKNGGGSFLSYYNCSPSSALQNIYPEHDWMLWRFNPVKRGYWDELMKDNKEIKRIINWLSEQLFIKCLDDWYRVSLEGIRRWIHIDSAKDLYRMLQVAYPEHQWDNKLIHRLGYQMKAAQREVLIAVQQLFPSHSNIYLNFCVQ